MINAKSLKIAHIVAEVSPYSKVGGLGDVGYALPKAILRLGHEVIIITPYYGSVRNQNLPKEKIDLGQRITIAGAEYPVSYRKHISPDGVPVYFVVNEELFGSHLGVYRAMEDEALRWIFFDRAALELCKAISFQPDIIHAHEWHAGLVPNYFKTLYKNDPFFEPSVCIFTIHNLAHQGAINPLGLAKEKTDTGTGLPPEQKNFRKYINFTKRAIIFSDIITTVSERYATEIITPQFGAGLDPYLKRRTDRLFGIINGIDYEVVNPRFDPYVSVPYDAQTLTDKMKNKTALQQEVGLTVDEHIPLIGMVNRLTEQKGFDLVIATMPTLLNMNLQLVIVGSGYRKDYLRFFRDTSRKHRNIVCISSPFSQKMASRVYAGSDIYLMPSRYEPCGLSQLISLRYGSIPIVHSVGGLHDTVTDYDPGQDSGNGFVFYNYNTDELLVAIARACESYKYKPYWNKLMYRAMKQSFSWDLPAKKYAELYRIALGIKHEDRNVAR